MNKRHSGPVLSLLLVFAALAAGCGNGQQEADTDKETTAWPSDLAVPIAGATFSIAAEHLPGAKREYRQGTHQGFDFINGMVSRPLAANHPVAAVAAGKVVRIDQAYQEPSKATLEHWSTLADEPGFLGSFALDRLRGRQVWIRHETGHVSRYAHLSAVNPDMQPGDQVSQGQVIGQTGKSGLFATADEPEPVPHLHFELWTPDGSRYLCQDREALACHRQVRAAFGEEALPRHARSVLAAIDEGEPAPETWPPEELPETGFSLNPPKSIAAGSAFAAPATWEGDAFHPDDFYAYLEGHSMGVIDAGNGAWVLAAVPLQIGQDKASLAVAAADEYGQTLSGSRDIQVTEREIGAAPVEVPSEILEGYTEENLQAESRLLAGAARQALQRSQARWDDAFRPPVEGEAVRRFGQEIYHGLLRPAHALPGVAIRAKAGQPVAAANTGSVVFADELPMRGNTVVLDHGGGVTTVYAHLSEITVKQGDLLDRGQTLGKAGSSGAAAGPRVRWEVHVAGIPTDPVDWMNKALPNRQPPAGAKED